MIDLGHGVTLEKPVALAPMSGVTDRPFRRLVRGFGCGLIVTEMIASREAIHAARQDPRLAFDPSEEAPLSVQLAGWDPAIMAEAAQLMQRLGARIIDINMGCPAKKVTKKAAGSALMRDLDHAEAILRAVVAAVEVPVTLKMRLGWTPQQANAVELARRAEAAGVRMLAVHGRFASQMYTGAADWGAIERVARAVSLPVLGNGDITDLATARQRLTTHAVAGIMVGRACYGRPWFPGQLCAALAGQAVPPDPSPGQIVGVIRDHYGEMRQTVGDFAAVRRMRKHLAWYAAGFRNAATFKREISTQEDPARVLAAVEAFFSAATVDKSTAGHLQQEAA